MSGGPLAAPPPRLGAITRSSVIVLAWGRNDMGQLGVARVESTVLPPARLDALAGKDVLYVGGSPFHSAFVTGDGELYTCGANDSGQLGWKAQSSAETQLYPKRVVALEMQKVEAAGGGISHTVALTDQGTLFSWGAGDFGQLGQGGEGGSQAQPRPVKAGKERFVRIAAGSNHNLALGSSGAVLSWGQGSFGALGHGSAANAPMPLLIAPLAQQGVVQVSCGENHSAALCADGRLFMWGRGKYGALGLGNFDNQSTPQQLTWAAASGQGQRCIQVSCGADHTVGLTAGGAVYCWGRGTWGQTGLGSTDNVCRPARVQGLLEHHTVQVSAGSRHTVVLTRANQVFAFGDNEFGQVGCDPRSASAVLSPQHVRSLPNAPVLFVAAAGDGCFAVHQAQEPRPGEFVRVGPLEWQCQRLHLLPYQPPDLEQLAAAASTGSADLRRVREVLSGVEDVFGSVGYLLAAFVAAADPNSGGGASSSAREGAPFAAVAATRSQDAASSSGRDHAPAHGLDVNRIQGVFQSLLRVYNAEVIALLGSCCLKLLDAAERLAGHVPLDPWVRVLFVLWQCPLLGHAGMGPSLCAKLVLVTNQSLSLELKQVLADWLAALPVEVLGGRVVRPLQGYITHLVQAVTHLLHALGPAQYSISRVDVLQAARAMALLYDANERAGGRLPYTEFHNPAVSSLSNLRDEYVLWLQSTRGKPARPGADLVSVLQAPFLLAPDAKSRILQGESNIQKGAEVQHSAQVALSHGIHPAHVMFLDIAVRRDQLLHDTLHQLVSRPLQDLKKPLRVQFISNGVAEEGVDEGGVSREFFQLLVDEIFQPQYGMFEYSEETRTFWFNHKSLESVIEFQLVGVLLGIAIYNGVILDVHFPQVVYKKLLGGTARTVDDLADAFPALARSFRSLLEMEGEVQDIICRTFDVEYDYFGATERVELKPGGSAIPVTTANRAEYVELYTKWLLDTSVAQQFDAFSRGFHQVCGGPALGLFRHEELELLICGLPHLDFSALQQKARYEGGYSAEHPTVRMFWQVVQGLSLEQKKRFLSFTTGCDRAPVAGLGALTLTIHRSGDSERLPSAHTCFNVLLLPDYSTREKLRQKLLMAIDNAQGFGLK